MAIITPKKIEAMLEHIDEIVNEDRSHWSAKRDLIIKTAKEMGERYDNALDEFLSWFEPGK